MISFSLLLFNFEISSSLLLIKSSCVLLYEIKEALSDEDKALLIKVFIAFGSYDEALLRDKLNEFILLRQLTLFNEIPKETITAFLIASFTNDGFSSNEIFSFIKDYYISENPVTEDVSEDTADVVSIEKMIPVMKYPAGRENF